MHKSNSANSVAENSSAGANDPNILLLLAADKGDLKEVQYLVEDQNANIEAKDNWGFTPFLYAASRGHLDILKYLIKKGAKTDVRDSYNTNPLIWATLHNHLEMVKYLVLSVGFDIDDKNKSGDTALTLAKEERKRLAAVYAFLDQRSRDEGKDDLGRNKFIQAAAQGNLDSMRQLKQDLIIEPKDYTSHTALSWAASQGYQGYLDVVKYLVEKGANIEAQNYSGSTPLLLATDQGHLDVVKYLVENGANVDARNYYEITPILMAIRTRRLGIVDFLKDKTKNRDGALADAKAAESRSMISLLEGGTTDNYTCLVCQEQFSQVWGHKCSECDHLTCISCCEAWSRKSNTCPTCRNPSW